jgi:hypothetical protein
MRTILLLVFALMIELSAPPAGWEESRIGRELHLAVARGDSIDTVLRTLGPPTIDKKLRAIGDGPVRTLEYVFADDRIRFDADPPLRPGADVVLTVDAGGKILNLLFEPNRFNFDGPRTLLASGSIVHSIEIVPGRGHWVRTSP